MKTILAAILWCGLAWAQTSPAPDAADISKLRPQLENSQRILNDWPELARYHDDNARFAPPAAGENRVVFMGDSITDGWGRQYGQFFLASRTSTAASAVKPLRRCSFASVRM